MNMLSWKQKCLWFGTGLLWGLALAAATGIWFLRTSLIEEKESALPYEQAVQLFPQQVLRQKLQQEQLHLAASCRDWSSPLAEPAPESHHPSHLQKS